MLRDLTAKHGECFARSCRTVREHAAVVALEHYVDEILQIILRKAIRKYRTNQCFNVEKSIPDLGNHFGFEGDPTNWPGKVKHQIS